MKITSNKEYLSVEIPKFQDAMDAIGEIVGKVDNILGVIAGNEQGICQLSDRTYKGKEPDICDFIVKTNYSREDFIAKCTEWDIDFFEYEKCSKCGKVIYGACVYIDEGFICWKCEDK